MRWRMDGAVICTATTPGSKQRDKISTKEAQNTTLRNMKEGLLQNKDADDVVRQKQWMSKISQDN